jgi:8-oxo-dGTP diphosphatase
MDQIKVGVGVLLWEDNKVLMGKRLSEHGHMKWSFPGGHVEFGENPEDAATREVKEETALIVERLAKVSFTSDIYDNGEQYVTLFFTATKWSGRITNLEPHKFSEWHWFPPEELPQPLFKPIATLLKELKSIPIIDESRWLEGSLAGRRSANR